uniref:GIY-YIG domain-containing protein n=1 Tax=viral metagenome TaxID=1070528 RepID=A0A6C0CAU5_9ZZZZ
MSICTWVCYLIYSLDTNQTYIGSSNNFLKRLTNHNRGKGAKRTKGQTWIPYIVITGFHHKNACLSFESGWKRLTYNRSNTRLEMINIMANTDLTYTTLPKWNRILDLLYFLHNVTLLDTKFKINYDIQHIVNQPEGLKIIIFAEDVMSEIPWPYFISIKNHKLSKII